MDIIIGTAAVWVSVSFLIILTQKILQPADQYSLSSQSVAFFCKEEDDSDMKIAGAPGERNRTVDELSDLKELEAQKRNGNLPKARALGTRLAAELAQIRQEANQETEKTQDSQNGLIYTFAVFYSVEKSIGSTVLNHVVINIFYDVIKQSQPDFYRFLDETGALSLYYLCVRRGGDVVDCLSRNLVSALGKDGDPATVNSCKSLMEKYRENVEKLIRTSDFSDS